jgi:hypothetical protein
MRASNVALFESWREVLRGPDGEGKAPKLWATIALPKSNGDSTLKAFKLV